MTGFVCVMRTDGHVVGEDIIRKMLGSIRFRGPDGMEVWVNDCIGLGSAHFHIDDHAGCECRPVESGSMLKLMGSIRLDARQDLISALRDGHSPSLNNACDQRLVLEAYLKWGNECTNHLFGDFSFAIWDRRTNLLFCARDRFGKRQLYFAQSKNAIMIGNCIASLLSHPELTTDLNELAIAGFLLFGDHTWIDKSITAFENINSLPAAHNLTAGNEGISTKRYWDLTLDPDQTRSSNPEECIEQFSHLFQSAVKDRLRGQNIGISLSGGMDSSAVAAIAKNILDKQPIEAQLSAMSIVSNAHHPNGEEPYIRTITRHLDIPSTLLSKSSHPFFTEGPITTRPLEIDQPAQWLEGQRILCQMGRVALTGDAGDNLLHFPGAVNAYREIGLPRSIMHGAALWKRYKTRPAMGLNLKRRLSYSRDKSEPQSAYPYPTWINPDFEKRLDLKERWKDLWEEVNFPESMLSRRSSMTRSLLRPDWGLDDLLLSNSFTPSYDADPFLDIRLVNYVLSLPSFPWLFNKHILRMAMQSSLPDSITFRPKTNPGLVTPLIWKKKENQGLERVLHTDLGRYLIKEKVPAPSQPETRKNQSYVNRRPIILDHWIKNLHDSQLF